MAKGKTPSLIGSALGRPSKKVCGRKTPCSRCREDIAKDEDCYDVPQPKKPHSSPRRFCAQCFKQVLEQTMHDFEKLEMLAL